MTDLTACIVWLRDHAKYGFDDSEVAAEWADAIESLLTESEALAGAVEGEVNQLRQVNLDSVRSMSMFEPGDRILIVKVTK